MFWGWYSSGNGRRSSGCFFFPFLCICSSLFWFSGFNSRFLWPLILIVLLGLIIPAVLNQGARQAYGEKAKRDFDEKPKRSGEYILLDDGEILEVEDPPHEFARRDYDDTL